MRTIILDCPPIPGSIEERSAAYRQMFPALSAWEVEDLSRIDPARFAIYTRSIFSGERDIIGNYFPMTIAYLRRYLDQEQCSRSLVQRMHRVRPWKSPDTEDLVENFRSFIASPVFEFPIEKSILLDLADFELKIFYTRRLQNGKLDVSQSLDRESVLKLTVADVLALRCGRPRSSSLSEFKFLVSQAHNYFYGSDRRLPDEITREGNYLAMGRSVGGGPHWRLIPRAVFEFLNSHAVDELFSVSDLAESFVATLPQDLDESSAFTQFLGFLMNLVDDGVLVLSR